MRVYLAGTITGDSSTHEWREDIAREFIHEHIVALTPLRGKNLSQISRDGLRSDIDTKLFVKRDEMDIRSCDAVLLYTLGVERLVRQSIGTWNEMGMAHILGKSIIVVADHISVIEHPFTIAHATLVVATLREAIEAIKFLRP